MEKCVIFGTKFSNCSEIKPLFSYNGVTEKVDDLGLCREIKLYVNIPSFSVVAFTRTYHLNIKYPKKS